MATYYTQKQFTLTKGVNESSTLQFGNFRLASTDSAKLIRYGIYLNEPTSDTTPSDPFRIEFFYESDTGSTISNASATNTVNAINLNDFLSPLSLSQYDVPSTFSSLDAKPFDDVVLKPNSGYEVIIPIGREIHTPNFDVLIGFKIYSGATLATGNVNGIFKIYIDATATLG